MAMLYAEYMMQAKNLVISQDEDGQDYYLEPEWKTYLYENELGNLEEVNGAYPLTWADVEDVLKLEVERRNKAMNKTNLVMGWLYEVISNEVDPMMVQEETEYMANILEQLKFRAEHPNMPLTEDAVPGDEKVRQILQSGMSFAKKE